MNTSNKILAGFFLIVFLVPALMLMAFKSKIKKGEYTIITKDRYYNGNFKTGKLQNAKVVKLAGIPGNALKVNFTFADSVFYNYNIGDGDSLNVRALGDTVYIDYRYTGTRSGDANLYFEMSAPSLEHLVVDNAAVNLLSLDSSGTKNMILEMKGTGTVTMGLPDENDFGRDRHRVYPVRLNQLTVKMDNASLFMGKDINIRQMNIDASGQSTLSIHKDVVIGNIRGSLSDSSSVDASWNYLKRFTALPVRQEQ